jgi:CBS domain-containing protein
MLALLASHTVNDLPHRDAPITCTTSESFEAAFSKLLHAGVLAAPLLDEATNKYIGFLDTRDLVSIALVVFDKSNKYGATGGAGGDELLKQIWEHATHAKSGLTTQYLASRNPFVAVEKGSSLLALVKLLLSLRGTRVRRVAVLDPASGKVVNVVSQMALVQFVAKQLNVVDENLDHVHLPELKQTIAATGCASRPAITIDETATAYDAFQKLVATAVGGLAVVDAHGHVTGNLSARDIKNFVKHPRASLLRMPVRQFIAELRNEAIDIRVPLFAVTDATLVRRAVLLFAGSRVHRLYIVDNELAPRAVGVFALSDVIKALFAGAIAEMAPVE